MAAYVRKDKAVDFEFPLPESLSGERVPRSMRVTVAWFTPASTARACYRLSSLEAIALDANGDVADRRWLLRLKTKNLATTMLKKGSVWSCRLIQDTATVPEYRDDTTLKIRVQCSDPSSGALDPDLDIRFALAASLEVEADVEFDVHQEIQAQIRLRLQDRG